MSKIIGIDLGTTNSVAAIMLGNEPVVIPCAEGERLVPSVVAINKNGERLVGRTARNQAVINPQNTISSVKRFMGRKINDPMVERTSSRIPYQILAAENGDVRVNLNGKNLSPPEIAAIILSKIKADSEAYLRQPIDKAVITVPAYFNDAQRNATKDAGRIAGLDVVRIINEPTASSLAYGLEKKNNELIAVYDLGGGTFDVSILEVGDGVFEVKATSGDTFLGGDDFDQRIMDFLNQEFVHEQHIDLRRDKQAVQRLREAAEKAKIELTAAPSTEINLPYITADASGPKHLSVTLTRARLEQLTADLIDRTFEPVTQALRDAGLTPARINQVVLVGGMTRMPAIRQAVREFFKKEPHIGVNPDEVVAVGAAIQAAVLSGEVKDVLLLDVTPLTLAIETLGDMATPVIPRNTAIPTRKTQVFSTATDNQGEVEIHITQGERPLVTDNKSLGKFLLDGIRPAPRGIPQIEVTFDIDANGILKVSAVDKSSGRSQHITLTASSGLSAAEVEQMRAEAQQCAEEDRQKREKIELRNQADSMLYQAERLFMFFNGKVPGEIIADVQRAALKLKAVINSGTPEEIRTVIDVLKQNLVILNQMGDGTHQPHTNTLPQMPPSAPNDYL